MCRRHKEFHSLHSCLQGRFPALVLPRLPRPPPTGGGIVLEPATLERARAGLQTYIAAVVAKVPAAWGLEEFVMFLDSDEKGRRLFARRKRKKETRRWVACLLGWLVGWRWLGAWLLTFFFFVLVVCRGDLVGCCGIAAVVG